MIECSELRILILILILHWLLRQHLHLRYMMHRLLRWHYLRYMRWHLSDMMNIMLRNMMRHFVCFVVSFVSVCHRKWSVLLLQLEHSDT
jgi:hypothetical protein